MPETLPTASLPAIFVVMLLLISIVGAWAVVLLRFAFRLPILPPNTPRVVPWGVGSVLLTLVLYVVIQFAMVRGYAIATHHPAALPGQPRANLTPGEMMTLSALQNVAVLAVIPLVLALTSGARLRDFGVTTAGLDRQVVRGVFAYPLLAPFVFGVMMLSVLYWGKTNHPLENAIMDDRSPGMIAILVLAGVILAPAAEELLFRGVLLGWLTRLALRDKRPVAREESPVFLEGGEGALMVLGDQERKFSSVDPGLPVPFEPDFQNPFAAPATLIETKFETVTTDPSSRVFPLLLANITVSLIFAALHGAVWPTPVPIFFLSLGLGLLYQRTGSILPCTVLHMTFNGLSTLLMFLTIGTTAPKPAPKPADSPKQAAKVISIVPPVSIFHRAH